MSEPSYKVVAVYSPERWALECEKEAAKKWCDTVILEPKNVPQDLAVQMYRRALSIALAEEPKENRVMAALSRFKDVVFKKG